MAETHTSLAEQLSGVPDSPGVYLWKDSAGTVIYVGKAKSLRKRMRQYVAGQDDREMTPLLMSQVTAFDYVVTDTEIESLILEKNLIRQFSPTFNVDYKDDKSYPYIALTTTDAFPAIKFTREKHREGTTYFGPYTDSRAARATIEAVRRVYPICSASCVEWKRLIARGGNPTDRACFDYSVGKGPGACVGAVSSAEYSATVQRVIGFMRGRHSEVADELESRMRNAAEELDYERAARFRNRLEALKVLQQQQKVVSSRALDVDVIGIHREETIAGVQVFVVREGRVLVGNEFVLDKGMDITAEELVEGFLLRYYDGTAYVPREVLLEHAPEDRELFEEWLSGLRGRRVRISVPRKGEKLALLQMASINARHTLLRHKMRTRYDDERLNLALIQLESALALEKPPMRIECYDISTLHGRHSVGSMVVFAEGRSDVSAYRRFRVRSQSEGSDDVGMMAEVLRRRFAPERLADERFGRVPDLVIVDGGKPQLSSALKALAEAGVSEVPVVALAKREEELFVPGFDESVRLPAGSASLYLVKRIRDEAHRFAVTYHRELRGKAMTASVLDDIPGVGPKRKKALVKAFGSVKRLRSADVEQIAAVPGISREVAEDVFAVLAQVQDIASDNG
ncbi:MAG: excinuclease ABC subunit UvrC [Actinobacteria bacterium]|nr:excinuclease ABC subunit UvrC [Actinomycetota bacterium]